MSYTSQQPYGGPAPMPEIRGPDIASAGLPARQLAEGIASVGEKWASFWHMAEQAKAVSDAGKITASASMELGDMVRGFDSDPDPAGAADRFRQRAAEWRDQKMQGLDPAVQRVVDRSLNQLIPAYYNQVAGRAAERTRTTLRAGLADTLGGFAQGLAAAPDEPTTLAQVEGIKATIAGHIASGVLPQADATKTFSTAVAQAITIRAATDPIAAQRMLDRFKAEMDAGTVASLTTHLRAPVERRQDQDAVEGRITLSDATRARADAVTQGLVQRGLPLHVAQGLAANAIQESGANPNVRAGDGGASDGLFQWNGSRRAAFRAQYGMDPSAATLDQQLDFTVAELGGSEKAAGDALAATRTAEDAARVGSTRFLRPRDTAVEERRRAGYATALAGGSARALVLDQVRQDAASLPLDRRLHREALVNQWFNAQEAHQEQARAVLGREVSDLSATYLQGQTAAAIPETRIRQLLPPDQAQRTIDTLTLERTAGDAYRAVQFASPADEAAMRSRLAGTEGDTYLAGERQKLVTHFDQAVAAKRRALADDPANVAMQSPEVQALAQRNATVPELTAASLAAQARMGVPAWKQRVLNDGQVAQMAATLRTTGPDKADMAATLAALADRFGPELWNRAYGELVQHGKIGWEWQAIAAMTAPAQAEGRARLQRALVFQAEKSGPEALKKLVAPDVLKGFDGEVDTAMEPLREATRHHPGGESLFGTMKQAVGTLALHYAWGGLKAGDAASKAYQDVIGARWDTAGDDGSSFFGRTPTMLVPKGRAGEIETALDLARTRVQPADLRPLTDPSNPAATDAELQAATHAAMMRGIWVNNADASGAVLKGRTPGGGIVDIARADGSPIEVRFNALPTLDRAARQELDQQDQRAAAAAQRQRMRAQ